MVNELSSSQNLPSSPSVELDTTLESPQGPTIKEKVFHALQADDWSTFEALALGENAEINIATERFDNGENCFHVALKSGGHSIVLNLAKLNHEWVRDLVNGTDQSRRTPLVYAADTQTDNPELIGALLNAGATEGFWDALSIATMKGHAETAKLLIDNDVEDNAPYVLESIVRLHYGKPGMDAAKLLISLGVNVTDSLPEGALIILNKEVAERLLLLGAKGSDKLAEIAEYRDAGEVEGYIQVGADVPRALTLLANNPTHKRNREAMTLVVSTASKLKKKPELEIYESALLRLARNKDIAGLQRFTAALNAINPAHLKNILNRLTAKGDSDALSMLTANPEDKLTNAALAGNFHATEALINAGVKTSTVPQLDYLIKTGDLQTASAFISVLENRNELLLQALQDGNEALGKLLLSNGAEGPRLLASLLHTKQRELAGQLLAWGVDVHAARMHLTAYKNYHGSSAKEDMFLMGADLSIAVMRAFEANNILAARQLTQDSFDVGSRSILHILSDKTVPDEVKTARLRLILQWNVSTDEAMQALTEKGEIEDIRRLVRLGVSVDAYMMDLSKQGDIRRIASLIAAGADIGKPMQTLQASNEHEALRTLTVALTMAQSNSILAHARANNLPYRINPSGSVELL